MYHKLKLLGLTPLLAAIAFAPSAHAAVSENIITTLYAYPTLPSWGQVESSAPTVGAAIVDICEAGRREEPSLARDHYRAAEGGHHPALLHQHQLRGYVPAYHRDGDGRRGDVVRGQQLHVR